MRIKKPLQTSKQFLQLEFPAMDTAVFRDERKKNHKDLVALGAAVHRGFNLNAKDAPAKITGQIHSITNSSLQQVSPILTPHKKLCKITEFHLWSC